MSGRWCAPRTPRHTRAWPAYRSRFMRRVSRRRWIAGSSPAMTGPRVPDAVQRFFSGAPQSRDPFAATMDPASAAHHAASAARCAASGDRRSYQDDDTRLPAVGCAIFRKQSRHRQSLPSTGIGRRAVSSAHQHGPDRLQVNSVPQPEQARRREDGGGLSNRFTMQRTALLQGFNSGFFANRVMLRCKS